MDKLSKFDCQVDWANLPSDNPWSYTPVRSTKVSSGWLQKKEPSVMSWVGTENPLIGSRKFPSRRMQDNLHQAPEPRPAQVIKAKKEWVLTMGLPEDCTLCQQNTCRYTPHQYHAACVKASRWLPARVHSASRSGRMEHTLSSCLPTNDDNPVTPRRWPRSANANEKRRKKAQINTITMDESEAPILTSFFKKKHSDSIRTTRGCS